MTWNLFFVYDHKFLAYILTNYTFYAHFDNLHFFFNLQSLFCTAFPTHFLPFLHFLLLVREPRPHFPWHFDHGPHFDHSPLLRPRLGGSENNTSVLLAHGFHYIKIYIYRNKTFGGSTNSKNYINQIFLVAHIRFATNITINAEIFKTRLFMRI